MKEKKIRFTYSAYNNISELSKDDAALLELARKTTKKSYAPYSNFHVASAARLANGKTVTGTNQENASYPVGICAERALLATIGTLYPGTGIETMAISYHSKKGNSSNPISPCGMCRQALSEYETRTGKPMRLILSGLEGEVYIIHTAKDLLPLGFGDANLK